MYVVCISSEQHSYGTDRKASYRHEDDDVVRVVRSIQNSKLILYLLSICE